MCDSRLPFGNVKEIVNNKSKRVTSARVRSKQRSVWLDEKCIDGISDSTNINYKPKEALNRSGRSRGWSCYYISWIFFLQNILLVLAHSSQPNNCDRCGLGLRTPGRTWPNGNIFLEYGQPLKIYCLLNKISIEEEYRGRNASDLVFFREGILVDEKYITVINETAIMMHMDQPSPSKNTYYCKLRINDDHGKPPYAVVCFNEVAIGFKPKKPLNFNCVSHNWENLVCSWEPTPDNIGTQFSLEFKLPGRAGRRFSSPIGSHNLPPNTCLWDLSTIPMYRQVYEYYTFTLNAENVLGSEKFTYRFHHWGHVIPSKPVNLSVINKTHSSVLLHWGIPFPMQIFPPGLHYRVSYRNNLYDSQDTWHTIDITNDKHSSRYYFNLTDLQHANSVYSVRVFLRSSVAVGVDKWSQFSEVTFKTAPTNPGLPPKTDIGSFEICGNGVNRDVYVYWQSIPQQFENADNLTYRVVGVEENGHTSDLQPYETTKTYAMFKGLSFNNLKFEIITVNGQGVSDCRTTVHVPSQLKIPQKPVVFTKIAFDGGIYELSWNQSGNLDIVDFTIFWCESNRDRPYQCSGFLDWVHVPQNTRIYNITVPDTKKIYQMAIASNTLEGSSGMAWSSSTTTPSNLIGKIQSVWINRVASDLVEVGWKLDYSGRIGVVEHFNIHYCPIVTASESNCDDRMIASVRTASYMAGCVIRDLKPNTAYSITVAVLTSHGEGLHSDAVYITTLPSSEPILPEVILLTEKFRPKSRILNENIEVIKQPCNSGNDAGCQASAIQKLVPNTADYIVGVASLSSRVYECMAKLSFLANENSQLHKTLSQCNQVR